MFSNLIFPKNTAKIHAWSIAKTLSYMLLLLKDAGRFHSSREILLVGEG